MKVAKNIQQKFSIVPVSYTHLDVYKRQFYNSGTYVKNYLILFEFTAVIVRHEKITLVKA